MPFVIAVGGPKGMAVAQELGDGVFAPAPIPGFALEHAAHDRHRPRRRRGSRARSGRSPRPGTPARCRCTAPSSSAPSTACRTGRQWLAAYDDVPAAARHLALHDGHMCGVNDHDRPFVTGELLAGAGLAMDAAAWREKLATAAADGATAVAYQPAGPDVPRELEAFMAMAQG